MTFLNFLIVFMFQSFLIKSLPLIPLNFVFSFIIRFFEFSCLKVQWILFPGNMYNFLLKLFVFLQRFPIQRSALF